MCYCQGQRSPALFGSIATEQVHEMIHLDALIRLSRG